MYRRRDGSCIERPIRKDQSESKIGMYLTYIRDEYKETDKKCTLQMLRQNGENSLVLETQDITLPTSNVAPPVSSLSRRVVDIWE